MNSSVTINPPTVPIKGEYRAPGDQVISQLALVLTAQALGPTYIQGATECPASVATRRVLAHLGVVFTADDEGWLAVTRRHRSLHPPEVELDTGASHETMRLMTGLLATQPFATALTNSATMPDPLLPRLVSILQEHGAAIELVEHEAMREVRIQESTLKPLDVELTGELRDLKNALLLTGMLIKGRSRLNCQGTPDHAERLLKHLGVSLRRDNHTLLLKGQQHVHPRRLRVPGDITAAAPMITAATLLPSSELLIKQLGANPGRTNFVKTLSRCGGDIVRERDWQFGTEPVSSFRVTHAEKLASFNIAPNLAGNMSDELPILALLASQTNGTCHLRGFSNTGSQHPMRVKRTADVLRSFGAKVEDDSLGLCVHGGAILLGTTVDTGDDPHLAMMATIAALISVGPSVISGVDSLSDCYPGFFADLTAFFGPGIVAAAPHFG